MGTIRRCSECGKTGHNSRTCTRREIERRGGRVKVFGVHLSSVPSPNDHDEYGLMRKSFSMPELSHTEDDSNKLASGYTLDGLTEKTHGMKRRGIPWTQEEHRLFLLGLQKIGKGHWKGISTNFVPTRTSTQLASHAQKYFLRLKNSTIKRCSLSLFDTAVRDEATFQQVPASCGLIFDKSSISQHSPNLELTLAGPHINGPDAFTLEALNVA